jgi:hypothetical protein
VGDRKGVYRVFGKPEGGGHLEDSEGDRRIILK